MREARGREDREHYWTWLPRRRHDASSTWRSVANQVGCEALSGRKYPPEPRGLRPQFVCQHSRKFHPPCKHSSLRVLDGEKTWCKCCPCGSWFRWIAAHLRPSGIAMRDRVRPHMVGRTAAGRQAPWLPAIHTYVVLLLGPSDMAGLQYSLVLSPHPRRRCRPYHPCFGFLILVNLVAILLLVCLLTFEIQLEGWCSSSTPRRCP